MKRERIRTKIIVEKKRDEIKREVQKMLRNLKRKQLLDQELKIAVENVIQDEKKAFHSLEEFVSNKKVNEECDVLITKKVKCRVGRKSIKHLKDEIIEIQIIS